MSCFIVAEIGVNAQGNLSQARRLVQHAIKAGADACKFQMFKDRPEIEHLRFGEWEMHQMADYCDRSGTEFMCTPFYPDAVAFLDPLVKRHKVASGFLTDRAMLDAVCATGKPVIVSTGMADWDTLRTLFQIPKQFSLLHCVSSYPCPDDEANLSVLHSSLFEGYSDHTTGTLACVAAVALGAQIIEKHITFDKTAEGPDHACSAEPEEFAEMARQIRRVERMLGDGVKRVMPSEAECAKVWRK